MSELSKSDKHSASRPFDFEALGGFPIQQTVSVELDKVARGT